MSDRENLELSLDDRRELLLRLLESLEGGAPVDRERVERAWEEETLRVAQSVDAGATELIPWDVVRARVFGPRR